MFFLETCNSMDIHTTEYSSLGIIDGTMRPSLGFLDATNGNTILYGFNNAFRYQEGKSFIL